MEWFALDVEWDRLLELVTQAACLTASLRVLVEMVCEGGYSVCLGV